MLHYFGCLRFEGRKTFFDALEETDKLRVAIVEEESRISRLRAVFEREGPTTPNGKLLSSFKIAQSHWYPLPSRRAHPPPPTAAAPENGSPNATKEPEVELLDFDDLNANVIYFKDNKPYDHPEFDGTFPNQKMPLSRLLKEDKDQNPLMWDCPENMFRYFHIPSNNMEWVEVSLNIPIEFRG